MNLIKNSNKLLNDLKIISLIKNQKCKIHENHGSVVELISRDQEVRYLKTVSNYGFRLNNGLYAVGPIVVFNEVLLSWNIRSAKEINPHSLSLFRMFVPKFEILIIGTGDKVENLHPDLIPYLSKNRVPYEIQRTKDATKLYNSMILDRRNVAAALIPPVVVTEPLRDSILYPNYLDLLESRIRNDMYNEMVLSRIILKNMEDIKHRFKTKHIATEELKKMIAAKNQAQLESKKKMRYSDIIADEIRAIREEEALAEIDNDKKPEVKSTFEKDKRETDDKKLLK